MATVVGFELLDLGHASRKSTLQIKRRKRKDYVYHSSKTKIAIDNTFRQSL